MEGGAAVSSDKAADSASYTYWVREATRDAAPLPVPKKIDPADLCNPPAKSHLGSAWNRASLVIVRYRKRVGYNYELALKVKGEWKIGGEQKKIKGHIDVAEFSFGELDDLEIQVKLGEDKDVPAQEKQRIIHDLKLFVQPLREHLLQFEEELRI